MPKKRNDENICKNINIFMSEEEMSLKRQFREMGFGEIIITDFREKDQNHFFQARLKTPKKFYLVSEGVSKDKFKAKEKMLLKLRAKFKKMRDSSERKKSYKKMLQK